MEFKDVEIISSHKYIKNTLTYTTVLTEDLLNTSRRPQTPERKRPPHNPEWDHRKSKEKAARKLRPSEGAVRVSGTERELQRRVSQLVCDRERAAVCGACLRSPARDARLQAQLGPGAETWV